MSAESLGKGITKSIAILGPGAVGGCLAALFWRTAHSVTVVGRNETIDAINQRGLHFTSSQFGEFTAHPRAITKLDFSPDILIITTKAVDLSAALERVPYGLTMSSIVIPFLNGIEHMDTLRAHFGRNVVSGAISIEAVRTTQGEVELRSPFIKVFLASDEDVSADVLNAATDLFREGGIECVVRKSEGEVIWDKLVRLNAITLTISASRKPIGFVRSDPEWHARLKKCVEEACAVANAEGVRMIPARVLAEINKLPETLVTSMARDIAQGKKPELDAIAGAIVRRGEKHRIPCPTIKKLMEDIERKLQT